MTDLISILLPRAVVEAWANGNRAIAEPDETIAACRAALANTACPPDEQAIAKWGRRITDAAIAWDASYGKEALTGTTATYEEFVAAVNEGKALMRSAPASDDLRALRELRELHDFVIRETASVLGVGVVKSAVIAAELMRRQWAAASWVCNKCGAVRQDWQKPDDDRCPMATSVVVECDGRLRLASSAPRAAEPVHAEGCAEVVADAEKQHRIVAMLREQLEETEKTGFAAERERDTLRADLADLHKINQEDFALRDMLRAFLDAMTKERNREKSRADGNFELCQAADEKCETLRKERMATPDVEAARAAGRCEALEETRKRLVAIGFHRVDEFIDKMLAESPKPEATAPLPDIDIDAISLWWKGSERGSSSECIASTIMCEPGVRIDHPRDLDDFGRCKRLVEKVHGARERLPLVAALSPQWREIVRQWDLLCRGGDEAALKMAEINLPPRTTHFVFAAEEPEARVASALPEFPFRDFEGAIGTTGAILMETLWCHVRAMGGTK